MKLENGLKIGAEVLLGGTILVMLTVSINDISNGNPAGIPLLAPVMIFGLFMWLGWIQPSETGIGLVFLGTIIIAFLGKIMSDPAAWIMLGRIMLITGLLLLAAGVKFRRTI